MFFLKTLMDSVNSDKDKPSSNEGGGGSSKGGGQAEAVDPNDTTNLGLGGLPSFLGTRKDAAAGKRGDAQIAATLNDNLPGYFNPETRDYVPWYVDLFDGGGINRSAGMLDAGMGAGAQSSGVMPATQAQGLLANNQLSDMERAQRSNLLGPFGGAGPAVQDTPDTSYYTQPSSMQMPFRTGPDAPAYTQPSSMQMPTSAEAVSTQFTPAPESTPRLSEMQTPMMQHPDFPFFVDVMKRSANERVLQDPLLLQETFKNFLKLKG